MNSEIRNLNDWVHLKDYIIFCLKEDLKEKEKLLEEKSAKLSIKDQENNQLKEEKESLQKAMNIKRKIEDPKSEGKIRKLSD